MYVYRVLHIVNTHMYIYIYIHMLTLHIGPQMYAHTCLCRKTNSWITTDMNFKSQSAHIHSKHKSIHAYIELQKICREYHKFMPK